MKAQLSAKSRTCQKSNHFSGSGLLRFCFTETELVYGSRCEQDYQLNGIELEGDFLSSREAFFLNYENNLPAFESLADNRNSYKSVSYFKESASWDLNESGVARWSVGLSMKPRKTPRIMRRF